MKKYTDPYKKQILHWWGQRETREQRLLAGLALVLLAAFFWFIIWQPMQTSIRQAESNITLQQNTLQWVKENSERVKQLREQQGNSPVDALSSDELTQFINQKSSELELQISRIQPQGEALLIVYNEADFDSMIELLAALAERQVRIDALDIAESNDAGVVRVRRLQVRAG